MRAARLYAPGDIRLAEEPVPAAGPPMSLVRVTAVGICGSDLHWWDDAGIGDARLERPLVLGHENAGVIAGGPRRGQRVAIDPAIPDETCPQCRRGYRNLCPQVRFAGHGVTDGGLREFLAWPDVAAAPAARRAVRCRRRPARAARRGPARARSRPSAARPERRGDRLRADRADADPAPAGGGRGPGGRRGSAAASPPGGGPVRRARQAGPEPAGDGVDTAFEVAGTDDAVDAAMTVVRPGGRVVLAGIPDGDRTSFRASVARRKGLTIAMSRRMNDAYPRAIALAASGRVDLASLVTRTAPLTEVADAFAAAARREGLKVVVRPGT